MEQIVNEIQITDPNDQWFLKVSTTYGRIKYEIVDLIWQLQIMIVKHEAGQELNKVGVTHFRYVVRAFL